MGKKFDEADAKFRAWRKNLLARLQQEKSLSARDIQVLMRPPRTEHVDNVFVTYLSFPVWLAKYDSKLTRGLEVNLNSYRAQKRNHQQQVMKQIDEIRGPKIPSLTGNALLDEIGRAKHAILILPWIFWDMPGPGELDGDLFLRYGMNQTTAKTDIANASENAKEVLIPSMDGLPDKMNNMADADGSNDVIINYTPHLFDSPGAAGTSGIHGPASETDEVLFHEMVHASRLVRGVPRGKENVTQGYTNEEEYLAILLSNIYLSEKGRRTFRASHENASALPDPKGFLNNAQHVNLKPRDLIANFEREQRKFYRDIAQIPAQRAPFNPVREYYEEQQKKQP